MQILNVLPEEREENMKESKNVEITIERTLRCLGITGNYRGYRQLCMAIALVIEDEDRLFDAKNKLYAPISEALHCNPATIERNIRTAIDRMWKVNQKGYHDLVGYHSFRAPAVLDFIDAIAFHLRTTLCINAR